MDTIKTANKIFRAAWELYVKYVSGPQGDPDIYWHNLAVESGKIAEKWPCGLSRDLVKAVLEEHSRREQRKNDSNK